jgi:hypothetical protein
MAAYFTTPAPAEGSPDDFYGFSLGSGFTLNDRFSLDIAYQYRFGNDVGDHILEPLGFFHQYTAYTARFSVLELSAGRFIARNSEKIPYRKKRA